MSFNNAISSRSLAPQRQQEEPTVRFGTSYKQHTSRHFTRLQRRLCTTSIRAPPYCFLVQLSKVPLVSRACVGAFLCSFRCTCRRLHWFLFPRIADRSACTSFAPLGDRVNNCVQFRETQRIRAEALRVHLIDAVCAAPPTPHPVPIAAACDWQRSADCRRIRVLAPSPWLARG